MININTYPVTQQDYQCWKQLIELERQKLLIEALKTGHTQLITDLEKSLDYTPTREQTNDPS